jgi:4-aminobutyrate aminotransferase-like enzyme
MIMASESTSAALAATNGNVNGEVKKELYTSRPTNILHRVPWRPPVATSAQGIYITLEDGRVLIDAAGGAAVTCIGNGHPAVLKAVKDQLDSVACTS